jgi:hypothetical protein
LLPTPATAARTFSYGYYSAGINLGEMFLNFPLHRVLQQFSGVDFLPYTSNLKTPDDLIKSPLDSYWTHLTRCWMGLEPTPGTWSGSVFITTSSKVLQTVAQSKWDKANSQNC